MLATILLAETIGAGQDDLAHGSPVRAFRGRIHDSGTADLLATFDAPGQAIHCAAALRDDACARGIRLRTAIHTGEVQLIRGQLDGLSLEIVNGIASHAEPDEILVSRTVKDLVVGSGISFADRGAEEVAGTADTWALFAVTGL